MSTIAIVDDVDAIRQRMEQIERERAEAQAAAQPQPFIPVDTVYTAETDPDCGMYCC